MKIYIYCTLILIFASLIYNLVQINYTQSVLSGENQPFVIGLGAAFCAIILAMILLQSSRLKKQIDKERKV